MVKRRRDKMALFDYPMVCEVPQDIEEIEDQVFDWLDEKVKVHFIFMGHRNQVCSPKFIEASEGLNPKIKIILIHPRLEVEVNSLVAAFNKGSPALLDGHETAVGDRVCPFCGGV